MRADLQAQGIQVEETVRPAWGAQGCLLDYRAVQGKTDTPSSRITPGGLRP